MGQMGGWMGEYRKEEEEGAVPPIPRAVILLLHRFLYLWRWVGGWVGGWRKTLTRSKAQVTSSLLSLLLNSIVTSRQSYLRKGAAMPMLFYVGEWVGGWKTFLVGQVRGEGAGPGPTLGRPSSMVRAPAGHQPTNPRHDEQEQQAWQARLDGRRNGGVGVSAWA